MEFGQIILISDMDGTLFDRKKGISDRNLKAIGRFREKGGLFTVATGRSLTGLRPYQERMRIRMPVILYNGSCIYDYQKERMIWMKELPKQVKVYVNDLVSEFPDMGIQIMAESGIYTYHPTPLYTRFMEREKLPYMEVKDTKEFPENWIKVEMTTDLMEGHLLDAYLRETLPDGCRWLDTGDESREIVASGVSKGSAILWYRELLGLSDKIFCCIGDHNNDYEMLQAADIGFAVENALEVIKEKADFIVSDNNHDAVAEAIAQIEQL